MIVTFFLTLCVGTLGGLIAKKIKIPAGAMLGAFFLVALFNVSTNAAYYPFDLRILTQIFSGILIGSRFTKKDVIQLRTLAVPVIILVISLLFFTVFFSVIMSKCTSVDLATAFFSCAPGGVSDLALISADFGANTEQVAFMQLARFIFVLLFFPALIKKFFLVKKQNMQTKHENPVENQKNHVKIKVFSLIFGITGGLLFRYLHIPAGAIIGALIFTVFADLFFAKVFLPSFFKTIVQIFAGCYIGTQITKKAVLSLPELFIPVLIVVFGITCAAFVTAFFIHKVTKIDFTTSLFACIPGGISEMGLIADDMGLDTPKIMTLHTCRVIAVICFFPLIAGIA